MNTTSRRRYFVFLLLAFSLFVDANAQTTEDPASHSQSSTLVTEHPQSQPHQQDKIEPNLAAQKKTEAQPSVIKAQQPKSAEAHPQISQPPKISTQQHSNPTQTQPQPTIDVSPETLPFTTESGEKITFQIDPLEENVIQKEQRQIEKEEIQKQQYKLHPWVADEFEKLPKADQIQTHQIFSFQITQESIFKWNPTEFKSGPLKFVVEVFNYGRGDITFPQNPEEDDYVEVLCKSETSSSYDNLGKVYIKKLFTINFFSDFQMIKIVNRYEKKMFVQVSLEATKFVPEKALDDDTLKIPAQKIKSILEQLQQTEMKREKTYRSEWSFRDRQQHHQSQMLILTGVELIVILGTAIVQMYCIKNLFDNRLIV